MSISLNRGGMFYSIKELVEQADLDFQGNVVELLITTIEFELTDREREEVFLHGTQSRSHESLCPTQPQ